ncbi:hypothetical protein C9975_03020 [Thalassospira xiamenensis]|nr:hypothetical protein C9975_03020 [Thalassospira xiamenensis]
MKKHNIRAYFAGDKSVSRIELAIADATDNRSYWMDVKKTAEERGERAVLGAANAVLESNASLIASLKKRLAKAVSYV